MLNTLTDLEVSKLSGTSVLLRCDLNVPLKEGVITDDGRIQASLPTIKYLLEHGAKVTIMAHLGRPKGERKPELSLAPIAVRLSELLGVNVVFSSSITDAKAHQSELKPGEVLLLENIRYEADETSKEESERQRLAKILATYGEIFVSDGFGAVHRKHASVYDVAILLPSYAGFLVAAEVKVLKQLTENPNRPYGVALGGAKVSDKLAVIENLIEKVDELFIGGGMVFTFLKAQGNEIGKSLVENDQLEVVSKLIARAKEKGVKLHLPTDIVVGPEFSPNAAATVVPVDQIPANQLGLDIGPDTATQYATGIKQCATVFWNGPMGVFEFPQFANGTKVLAKALTEVKGLNVVGGGDSAAAVRTLGFSDSEFGYISTGGGASLEYLEGKELPGIKVLEHK